MLAVSLTAAVFAQQSADPDLSRIRTDIARLKQRLADVRKQAQSVELELEAADLELGIRTRELEVTLDTHARIERERNEIAQKVDELVPRIARQKDYLARRLAALYRLGGLSYVRMFLSVSEQLAERQKELAAAAKEIEAQRRSVADAHAQKKRLLARLNREASGSEVELAELEEKARRLERLVNVLSNQQQGAFAGLDIRQFRGALAWPVEGKVIESFGRQRNPKFATYTTNNGLKIEAAPREPVRAVFQGTVLFSQWFRGYGNLIILDHGNRVFSLYGNLNGPSVAVGDRIVTGQSIAGVGEAEDAESGYLYFEIREDNRPEDPTQWLR